MIRISVVIPTHNRRPVLERTLPAILAQEFPPDEYEVLVVTDDCTDGTAQYLRSLNPSCVLRILETRHRCAGAARNAGIQAAKGELVLFLDDDLLAGADLLRLHCEAHSSTDPSVVQGRMHISPDSSPTMIRGALERIEEQYYSSLRPDLAIRYPEGAEAIYVFSYLVNSSIPRRALIESGGFDELFVASEELDLGLRLWKMGLTFRYQPEAIVHEYYVKSSAVYLRSQARAFGAGHLLASRKHSEYRPFCGLSSWARRSALKQWFSKAITSLPYSLIPVLSLPLCAEKVLFRFAAVRSIAIRYLNALDTLAHLEGALNAAGSWKAIEDEFGRRAPSLLYHHVGPQRPGADQDLTVTPEHFERQIRWLARMGYVGIRAVDWLNWIRYGTSIPAKPILLTFDDAYADTADYALPILKKYGFGATVFVVTARLGATNTWDEVQGRGTLQLMTAEQIRAWAEQGIEFGAHSRTHAHLTKLSGAALDAEVAGSKIDLAALLGQPPVSFAYPYGEFNEAVRDRVRREFEIAFSADEGLNDLTGDLHLLRRSYVGPTDTLFEFVLTVRRGGIRRLRDWRVKLALRTRLRRMLGISDPHSGMPSAP